MSLMGETKNGSYDMPNTQNGVNGRLRGVVTVPPVQVVITGWKVLNLLASAALVLLYSGWIILPAKDSDLKNVSRALEGHSEAIQSLALDIRGIRSDIQRTREELLRMGVLGFDTPVAAAEPVRRRVKLKPRVDAAIK